MHSTSSSFHRGFSLLLLYRESGRNQRKCELKRDYGDIDGVENLNLNGNNETLLSVE